jgi:hypothetical protein
VNDPVELLDKELAALCRGRGLQDPKILDRLGPTVREALGIRYSDDAAEQRRQLQVGLYEAARSLPPDLRTVFIHAMGFDPAGAAYIGDRLEIAGKRLDRDTRTVRRRLTQARHHVAENLASLLRRAASNNRYVGTGWLVDSLHSLFRLDLPAPRLTESREIIATVEGLDSITANVSLPSPPPPADPPMLEVVAEDGCTVASAEQVSASHWRYELALPVPLHRGERHHYVVTFVTSSLGYVRPYYVLVPFFDVRAFSAEVHFGSPPVSRHAWRLDGVPPAVIEDSPATAPDFDTEKSPVIRVEFMRARPGLCYGLHWDWSDWARSIRNSFT